MNNTLTLTWPDGHKITIQGHTHQHLLAQAVAYFHPVEEHPKPYSAAQAAGALRELADWLEHVDAEHTVTLTLAG